ncbi:hypothetical protein JTB14_009141 [Gonioctena quinquepunctata]|nr:hypothetical protein JTB14_009141 [Gonioctena quinquepunctata]
MDVNGSPTVSYSEVAQNPQCNEEIIVQQQQTVENQPEIQIPADVEAPAETHSENETDSDILGPNTSRGLRRSPKEETTEETHSTYKNELRRGRKENTQIDNKKQRWLTEDNAKSANIS